MANVKVTQDKNGVRWLELMRSGSGTLLEIRDNDEALLIISALQQSVQADGAKCACPEPQISTLVNPGFCIICKLPRR